MNIKVLLSVVSIFALFSCATKSRLEVALELSKENRSELEKVIQHYSDNPSDSLKLKAAIFLIENMPGHYTYEGKYIDDYIHIVDSLNPNLSADFANIIYSLPLYDSYITAATGLKKRYDIHSLTSEFLIKNIDYKFALMDSVPWGKYVDFEEFCEFILSYRIDIEPLIADKIDYRIKNVNEQLKNVLKTLKYTDTNLGSTKKWIAFKLFPLAGDRVYKLPNNQSHDINCVSVAYSCFEKFKLLGIPSMIDFTPHWANQSNRHYWNKLSDINYVSCNINENILAKMAKAYRITYSHNDHPAEDGNYIPEPFTPFNKDVTSEYLKCKDLEIQLDNYDLDKPKNVYLAVFNELKWQSVAWARAKNDGKVLFEDLGTDIVYQLLYYRNNTEVLCGYPIILRPNGDTQELIADNSNKIKIRLERKYPHSEYKLDWSMDFSNLLIEASNDVDFIKKDTIAPIHIEIPQSLISVKIDNEKKYRFWRLKSTKGYAQINIAELYFRDRSGQIIRGDYIVPPIVDNFSQLYIDNNENKFKIADNNEESFSVITSWVGIDFKRSVAVSSVDIVPRSDTNFIYPDNDYELLYCTKKGWQSLGVKTATNYYVDFEDVPSGALYWLRNRTKGQEERIFTYENGDLRFW